MVVSVIFVSGKFSIKDLLGNLLMLQDFETGKPGNIVNPFLGNTPLWSLSYEWVFYLLFPFVFPVIKGKSNRVHVIGFFSVINLLVYILFPNHIFIVFAYFLIWWTGLEIAEYFVGTGGLSKIKTIIIYYLISILLLAIVSFTDYRHEHTVKPGIYPYLLLRHSCFGLVCLIISVYFTKISKFIAALIKPFASIAPISYGIYILHYPILVQSHFGFSPLIELACKVPMVLALAYLVEMILQPRVNKILR